MLAYERETNAYDASTKYKRARDARPRLLTQDVLRAFARLLNGHKNRAAFGEDIARNRQSVSAHRLARNQTQSQPDNAEKNRRQHVGQIMRAQGDATEANEQDDQYCAGHCERAPAPRFDRRDYKKCELPVKQSRSNGVTASKAVARPVHELAGNEWTRPMDKHLDQLIQQHAARYGHD